ncbi:MULTISPECIES: hypothetical protein [Actinoalloteichus]|uniref:ABC transporter n=1 Tax=Actinoalloteichus fjordicus TaxID=1612552 RepID=A0AAC9LGM7_9PSEU|nr:MULTISPECIES: hypothetical protein [Actinoalloteichus]APU15944.1 hypothetical protein UA74_19595 [Actinoalloteichus fjordicus]APU22007.1 hypothetical protein UA75_20090 [Actinoalloteichus sp. GBA129-24]
MKSRINRVIGRAAALVASAALIASCGGGPADDVTTATDAAEEEVPHGYVEGAEETAEAQSRLIVADEETGAVRVVDLITEEVFDVGRVEGVRGILGDGRFGYLTGEESVHVVDGGSWMVDHGDHVHYYRAEARDVGPIAGEEPTNVSSDPVVSAVSFADGTAELLDRARLDEGAVDRLETITGEPHSAATVAYREHLLTSKAEAGSGVADGVEVRSRDGEPVARIEEPCPDLRGQATTRRGVVFGCADGALLVTEDDGAFAGEKIPYPQSESAAERAVEFHHRPLSTTLVGAAGDEGVWVLDVTEREWRHLATGPVVAVNAVGEGAPVLTLTNDGVLHALDPETGEETAQSALLSAEAATAEPAPVIQVDTTRAYVNDPSAGEIHEIDYGDDLRLARTFAVDGRADHMVETGR